MKKVNRKFLALSLLSSLFLTSASLFAKDIPNPECTQAAIDAAEQYDPGSSAYTTCIAVRDDFKVVVAWNSSAHNGKIFKQTGSKVGQQVVNARNLVRDYTNNYAMEFGEDYSAVVVAYASGVDWLRTTSDQANQDMINGLMADGVKVYACQNTMKAKGLVLADLMPGVEIVPAGVTAVVDFQNQKYKYLNP